MSLTLPLRTSVLNKGMLSLGKPLWVFILLSLGFNLVSLGQTLKGPIQAFTYQDKKFTVGYSLKDAHNIDGSPLSVSAIDGATFQLHIKIAGGTVPGGPPLVKLSQLDGISVASDTFRTNQFMNVRIEADESLTSDVNRDIVFNLRHATSNENLGRFRIPIRFLGKKPEKPDDQHEVTQEETKNEESQEEGTQSDFQHTNKADDPPNLTTSPSSPSPSPGKPSEPTPQKKDTLPGDSFTINTSGDNSTIDSISKKAYPSPTPQDPLYDFTLTTWIIILVGGVVCILFIILAFRNKSGKNAEASAESTNNSQQTEVPVSHNKPHTDVDSSENVSIQDPPLSDSSDEAKIEVEDDDIAIIEHAEIPEDEVNKLSLDELAADNRYLPIDLTGCWADTAVETLYMHTQSINGIYRKVLEENDYVPQDQMIEDVPEIGGFLIGHVYQLENDRYSVSIEEFVPITAESQSRYTVKFGGLAWSQLDDRLKANPGIKLVGWFHTHPNHGLFLSEADLREQHSLFTQPYQIAMEIDSLKPHLDTAFFTWKQSGEMNNADDRKRDTWWFFDEINIQMRDRKFGKDQAEYPHET